MQWSGLFKSYEATVVVPLSQMTAADWRWLEHENLSNIAKNRIADKLDKGFFGFAKVRIFSKGKAKDLYFQPVTVGEAQDALSTGKVSDFGHFPEDAGLSKAATQLEQNIGYYNQRLLAYAAGSVIAALVLTARNRQNEELEKQLREANQYGFVDYLELDQALSTAMILQAQGNDSEWVQEFIDEAEQILGEAEDQGAL